MKRAAYILANIFFAAFIVLLGVIVFVWLKAESQIPQQRLRAFCQQNLKCIGIACHCYANDHGGTFPQSLTDLYPQYISADNPTCVGVENPMYIFVCPASKVQIGDMTKIDAWSSYEIVYTGPYTGDKSTVTVQEKKDPAHPPGGRNCAFGDDHVEFRRTKYAPKMIGQKMQKKSDYLECGGGQTPLWLTRAI